MHKFTYQMNYDERTCSVVSYTGDEPEIIIPEQFCGRQVTILFDNLFAGHPELRSVRFPDSITDFGEFLFDGCAQLTKVVYHSNVDVSPDAFGSNESILRISY